MTVLRWRRGEKAATALQGRDRAFSNGRTKVVGYVKALFGTAAARDDVTRTWGCREVASAVPKHHSKQQRAMESDETCDKMEDGAALAVSTGWGRRNLLCLAFGSALKGAREIWLLSNFDSQKDIAYPNDTRVPIKGREDECSTNSRLLFQTKG
ncbi:hypothetical protein PIB30_057423 [Stylosanthes scabra]|uniref:Uncharacterized protein n=1 Tax=Stylosanthes scabra TaxID=79078 RepID=A0ABU6RKF6_9FABA|nr:hypothetical protein [Stylosanthes scabra]